MKKLTHSELDKIWNKLTKEWKFKALQFIEDERMIVENARRLKTIRDKTMIEIK